MLSSTAEDGEIEVRISVDSTAEDGEIEIRISVGCTSVIAMAEEQQFCLRWNNFHANITSQFEALRDEEDFVDVTLACDGQRLKAHKVVLSACSPYFKELFKASLEQHFYLPYCFSYYLGCVHF
uniref:(California timema) hypothetical protein n=1 Tax=Timema californicum TaxID=61474 RepID=A0A7R9IZL5_TIMCA|nr:unnamed protein product [Timema californicum]